MWEYASSVATATALVAVGTGVAFFTGFTATIPVLVAFIASSMSTSVAAALAVVRSRRIAKQHAQLEKELEFDHRRFNATVAPADDEIALSARDLELQGVLKV